MEQVVIDSIDSYERTQRRLSHLLSKEGSASTAVALAEALVPGQGQDLNVRHLRACVYTDAGIRLKDLALLEEGVRIWGEMEPHDSVTISYNFASGPYNCEDVLPARVTDPATATATVNVVVRGTEVNVGPTLRYRK